MCAGLAAEDVKLIPHRWFMHAIQALSNRDYKLLNRVFIEIDLPKASIDAQVQAFDLGAPLQYHSFGFFDAKSAGYGLALFQHVQHGDTLLHIALRHNDPKSAAVLIVNGASLTLTNVAMETPVHLLYNANALVNLCHKEEQTGTTVKLPTEMERIKSHVLPKQEDYHALFGLVEQELLQFHDNLKAQVQRDLIAIYTEFAPERISKVTMQLQDFEYRELLLLDSVKRKYILPE